MGVPKFFRFISDRYPCINKIVKEHEIPKYDNLYLDMTSIIHTCSHPTDSDIHFRIGKKEFLDEDIYQNVCRYVDIIFRIVQPAELMYLAFDGVAPRAKMNQQRANRFRVAQNINKSLIEREIRDDVLFDANCITPGTAFMAELIEYTKHFVAYKISTDPFWQTCKIIFSGSDVPGEGEHKIMQFIRYSKAQPKYNQNTRHCLYSLDADLIMLGLCAHEPHFSLIREKDTFGKSSKMLTPEETDFHLLHLSLVREYLEYEFASIKPKLKFDFDIEKIIDDWVLIGFLVGNDFIPQLPNLNIVSGALPLLYQVYMNVLPTLDGYINEAGDLHLVRFEKYIKLLSYAKEKMAAIGTGVQSLFESCNDDVTVAFEKVDIRKEDNAIKAEVNFNMSKENTNASEETKIRAEYYKQKLKFDNINNSSIQILVENYIKAIQWTLNYYYHECSSWSWYYPYHYAPFISDIKNLENINFKFEKSKPFLPLQHLLAVLPPANSHLLPSSLRSLLTSSSSPIVDFYPDNFEIDLNGKINDWEAVVLIPFIDENRLIEAMDPHIAKLSTKERKRNTSGHICSFIYTRTSLGQYPVDTVFDSFISHAQKEHIKQEDLDVPKNKLIKGLCRNVRFDLSFPGFPTLKHVTHTFGFQLIETKTITNQLKQIEAMVLNISPKPVSNLEELASKLLGQSVYINWPHLREAHVIGVTNFEDKIFLDNYWKNYGTDNSKHGKVSETEHLKLQEEITSITNTYKQCQGINIGDTKVVVFVFPIMGKRYVCDNSGKVQLQSKWSSLLKPFPYQLIVEELHLHKASTFLYKSVTDIFESSSKFCMVGHPNYGSIGEIKKILKPQRLAVSLEVEKEPDFKSSNEDFFTADSDYMRSNLVAKKLNVTSILINKISGSLIVTEDSPESDESRYYDIGLRIKLPKRNKELFGFTKRRDNSWYYSSKAIQLIQNYIEKFPELFININKDPNLSTFKLSDLFPEGLQKLDLVKTWLVEQQSNYMTFLECGTKTLGLDGVSKVEKLISDFMLKEEKPQIIQTEVPPQILYRPGTIIGLVPPDIKAHHKLLDRIICVRENFTVPFGFKGTIVGIQEKDDKWKNIYEILFDASFTGGLTLYQSSENRCYRLTVADFVNVSFGQRDGAKETKKHYSNVKTATNVSLKVPSIKENVIPSKISVNIPMKTNNFNKNRLPNNAKENRPNQATDSSKKIPNTNTNNRSINRDRQQRTHESTGSKQNQTDKTSKKAFKANTKNTSNKRASKPIHASKEKVSQTIKKENGTINAAGPNM